jgi:hypothetical protein
MRLVIHVPFICFCYALSGMKSVPFRLAALASALAILVTSAALAYKGEKEYGKFVKVSLANARAAAQRVFAGKVTEFELEKIAGGSGLRYSFMIASGAVTHEVGIDAISGKVLENSVQSKDSD